jgi:hypothetical protein
MLSLEHLRTDALLTVLVVTAFSLALLRMAEWLARVHVERVCDRALARVALLNRTGLDEPPNQHDVGKQSNP